MKEELAVKRWSILFIAALVMMSGHVFWTHSITSFHITKSSFA